MWNGLDTLLDLQRVDAAISRLEAEARAIPQAIQVLDARLAEARATLGVAKATVDQIQKDRRSKERELDEAALGIKKKQARLFEIKTNEEYSAVLREIETSKEKQSKLEEQILELMERADVAAKAAADAVRKAKAAEAACQRERAEKEAQFRALQHELEGLREARKGQAGRIESSLLQQYTRLVKSRGVAVIAVKDGSCGGCGITLTPQTYNEVRRNDRMFTCTSCNRILYYAG